MRRCPRSLPAAPQLHVAARLAAHSISAMHVAARPAAHSSRLGYMSLPAPQLTAASRLHVAARPAAQSRTSASRRCPLRQLIAASRLHDAARPAARQQRLSCMLLPAPVAHSRTGYTRHCPPPQLRSSQPHLSSRLGHWPHVAARSAAHHALPNAARLAAPPRPPLHLGYTSLSAP